jgi:hypothetical protein
VGVPIEALEIGMPLHVVFEHHPDPDGDVWIPLFAPPGYTS